MYPFDSRLQWWLKGRYAHLVAAMERHPHLLEGKRGGQLQSRLRRIKTWLIVRLVIQVLLFAGLAASLVGIILGLFPALDPLQQALDRLVRITTTFAGLFTIGYLLATRTLAMLEIDAIMLFHLEHHAKA